MVQLQSKRRVQISGDYHLWHRKRQQEIPKIRFHKCFVYDYYINWEAEEECTSEEVKNIDENRFDFEQGDCVVYNQKRDLDTDKDGYRDMVVQFDAVLEDAKGNEEYSLFPIPAKSYTREYYLFFSDNDLTVVNGNGFWNYIPIPPAGQITFSVSVSKQKFGGDQVDDVYTIQNFVHLPWDKPYANEDGTVSTDTFIEIWISAPESGVDYVEKTRPSATVILGSLWGFFGLVMTGFYFCFAKDLKQPGVLVRRFTCVDKKDAKKFIRSAVAALTGVDAEEIDMRYEFEEKNHKHKRTISI